MAESAAAVPAWHRLATGLVLALGLAACGGSDDEEGNSESGGKVELTFWSWVPGVDKAVALWNKENPDIQVKLADKTVGSQGGYAKMHACGQGRTTRPTSRRWSTRTSPSSCSTTSWST